MKNRKNVKDRGPGLGDSGSSSRDTPTLTRLTHTGPRMLVNWGEHYWDISGGRLVNSLQICSFDLVISLLEISPQKIMWQEYTFKQSKNYQCFNTGNFCVWKKKNHPWYIKLKSRMIGAYTMCIAPELNMWARSIKLCSRLWKWRKRPGAKDGHEYSSRSWKRRGNRFCLCTSGGTTALPTPRFSPSETAIRLLTARLF